LVIVCGLEGLVGLEKTSGDLVFESGPGSMYSSPLIRGGLVYWPGAGEGWRSLYAARLDSGEVVWVHPFESPIHFTPSTDGERIFCASIEHIRAIDPETGSEIWSERTGGHKPVDTAIAPKDILLVGMEGVGLVAFESRSGKHRWTLDLPYGAFAAPCADEANGVAYVVESHLRAVDLRTGHLIWETEESYGFKNSAPIVLGDRLFVGGGHIGAAYLFDTGTGEKVWEQPLGDLVFSTPASSAGSVIIGSHDGYVYCFA